jgi:hypothetical protein
MGLPIQTNANMSVMFEMLSSGRSFHDENVVRQIRTTFQSPTPEYFTDATPQVVFDDESWGIFKSNLARQAKQRKKENATTAPQNKKIPVRSNRDVSFDRIQLDNAKKIVKICKSSYEIVTYNNFNEIKKAYNKTEADEIYNVLTGECDSGEYYWTQP